MPGSPTSQPFIFDSASESGRGPVGRSLAGNQLGDPLIQQTKREIAQMLSELAAAARDEIPAEKFASILCDRTLRAMSAEGIVIWESTPSPSMDSLTPDSSDPDSKTAKRPPAAYRPIARLGRVTDRNIEQSAALNAAQNAAHTDPSNPSAAWLAHQCLLSTIVSDGEPAVVPSTPEVTEPQVPANPSPVPAALVPIDCPSNSSSGISSTSRVIEVFLEPGGGIATQRGYLRFVCQVADLAGEYYRSEQLRTLLWHQSLAEKCDQLISQFHELDHSEKLATLVVDQLAEIFQLDRVAISRVAINRIGSKAKTRIIAVSHVEVIDQYSDSAAQIRSVSNTTLDATGATWMQAYVHAEDDSGNEDTSQEMTVNLLPLFAISGSKPESSQPDHGYRLTGFRRAGEKNKSLRQFEKRELLRTVRQALRSMQQIDRSRQSKLHRLINRQSIGRRTILQSTKRFASFAIIAAVVALVMIIPVPKTIEATATLRAQDTQRICAVGDAVVESIQVKHGQHVRAGEVLMVLSDSNLEQQITTLVGRRAVLAEQKMRLTEDMVDSSASDFESYEKIQGQRSVVDEEIASVNQQLALLDKTRASLVIRSDRDGVVDAWQINKRFNGRPVSRGDALLQVVSHDSAWLVDAEVSQSRIERVRHADRANELSARVTIDDAPGLTCVASEWQFGPTRQASLTANNDQVKTAVTLSLGNDDQSPSEISSSITTSRTGAPARVYFHCGSVPLGDLLVGDLYRDIRSHLALHWHFPGAEGARSF